MRMRLPVLASMAALVAFADGCGRGSPEAGPAAPGPAGASREKTVLRVGHFPNVTHAQAVAAHALSRRGKGWFEERLGPGVEIQWFIYNAGPSAMEAIFADSLDITYVGPNPALNAYMKSRGEEIRIIRGSAVGGSALVVQGDGRIKAPADFRGKKVATPQFGNTQDVACREWLMDKGFTVTQAGGDVNVLPTANPDQLSLFKAGNLDAVWTVEPWVSRLLLEAGGKIYLEEPEAVTTILVSSVKFLGERRDLARKFAEAHSELTSWMEKNREEAQKLVQEELRAEMKAEGRNAIPLELVKMSWGRLKFSSEIFRASLEKSVAAAQRVGFIRDAVDLSRLVESP